MSWAARREKLKMQFLLRAKEPCRQSSLCERLKLCINPQCTVRQLVLKFENDRYSRIESSLAEKNNYFIYRRHYNSLSASRADSAQKYTLISAGIIYAVCREERAGMPAENRAQKTHTFTRHRESRHYARGLQRRESKSHTIAGRESGRHYSFPRSAEKRAAGTIPRPAVKRKPALFTRSAEKRKPASFTLSAEKREPALFTRSAEKRKPASLL